MGVDYVAIPKLGGFFKFNPTPSLTFFDSPSIILNDKTKYPQGFATPGAVQIVDVDGGTILSEP